MSDVQKLKQNLIKIGNVHPELRSHIKAVLSSLIDPNEMFGELRAALSSGDVNRVLELEREIEMKDRTFFKQTVQPYLTGQIRGILTGASKGDKLILHRATLPKPALVTVVHDQRTVASSNLFPSSTLLVVKLSRGGKRLGTLEMDTTRNTIHYKSDVNAVPDRVVLVRKR